MILIRFIILSLATFVYPPSCNGKRGRLSMPVELGINKHQEGWIWFSKLKNLSSTSLCESCQLEWKGQGPEYAGVVVKGSFFSAYARISVFRPDVKPQHVSSMYIAIESGEGINFNQIQVGWTVNPDFYGDSEVHLYAKWTGDNNKVCYNTQCPDFVPTWKNTDIPLGGILEPSTVGHDPQQFLVILLYQVEETGIWYLDESTRTLGYWEGNFFSTLSKGATVTRYFGEVYTPGWSDSSPPMGSGIFKNGIPSTTCIFEDMEDNVFLDPPEPQIVETRCYFVAGVGRGDVPDNYGFFIGGSGGRDLKECYYPH